VKLIGSMPGGIKIGADLQGASARIVNAEDENGHTCGNASPPSHTVKVITGK
jgi:hypothetical protein